MENVSDHWRVQFGDGEKYNFFLEKESFFVSLSLTQFGPFFNLYYIYYIITIRLIYFYIYFGRILSWRRKAENRWIVQCIQFISLMFLTTLGNKIRQKVIHFLRTLAKTKSTCYKMKNIYLYVISTSISILLENIFFFFFHLHPHFDFFFRCLGFEFPKV